MTATSRQPQHGHMRFIGGRVYCPRAERRVDLGADHVYGREFVCPGCNVRIGATIASSRSDERPGGAS